MSYVSRVHNIVARHDPANIAKTDKLLEMWRGKEAELLNRLEEKYSINSMDAEYTAPHQQQQQNQQQHVTFQPPAPLGASSHPYFQQPPTQQIQGNHKSEHRGFNTTTTYSSTVRDPSSPNTNGYNNQLNRGSSPGTNRTVNVKNQQQQNQNTPYTVTYVINDEEDVQEEGSGSPLSQEQQNEIFTANITLDVEEKKKPPYKKVQNKPFTNFKQFEKTAESVMKQRPAAPVTIDPTHIDRVDMTATAYRKNDMVVYGGGMDAADRIWFLDLTTAQWYEHRTSGEIPRPRQNHSAVVNENTLFVTGGELLDGSTEGDGSKIVVHALDLGTFVWTQHHFAQHNDDAPANRSHHTTAVLSDRLYLFGGRPFHATTTGAIMREIQTGFYDVFMYEIATNTWVRLDMREARHAPMLWGHTAVSAAPYRQFIVFFGGFNVAVDKNTIPMDPSHHPKALEPAEMDVSNATYLLNLQNMEWSAIPLLDNGPRPRVFHSALIRDGQEMMIYGGIGMGSAGPEPLHDYWQFDIRTGMWSKRAFCVEQWPSKKLLGQISSDQGQSFIVTPSLTEMYAETSHSGNLQWFQLSQGGNREILGPSSQLQLTVGQRATNAESPKKESDEDELYRLVIVPGEMAQNHFRDRGTIMLARPAPREVPNGDVAVFLGQKSAAGEDASEGNRYDATFDHRSLSNAQGGRAQSTLQAQNDDENLHRFVTNVNSVNSLGIANSLNKVRATQNALEELYNRLPENVVVSQDQMAAARVVGKSLVSDVDRRWTTE